MGASDSRETRGRRSRKPTKPFRKSTKPARRSGAASEASDSAQGVPPAWTKASAMDAKAEFDSEYQLGIDLKCPAKQNETRLLAWKNFGSATPSPQSVPHTIVLTNGQPIPMIWSVAKGRMTQQQLLRFGVFRKQIVDSILRQAACAVGCDVGCFAASVGSITPTSDYDITVTGDKRVDVVARFHEIFRSEFTHESGDVFDTNIYGSSFYSVGAWDAKQLPRFWKTFSASRASGPATSELVRYPFVGSGSCVAARRARRKDVANQHVWALVKYLLYCPHNRVETVGGRVGRLYRRALAKHTALHDASVRADSRAMNLKYVKMMRRENRTERALEMAPTDLALQIAFKDRISQSNYYGSETYFTLGAMFHVVGQLQEKFTNIPITRAQYIDSFIENMGDVCKDLKHTAATCQAVIQQTKYLYRALHALLSLSTLYLVDLSSLRGANGKRIVTQNTLDKVLFVRSSIRGKQVELKCSTGSVCVLVDEVQKHLSALFEHVGMPAPTPCAGYAKYIRRLFIRILLALKPEF